MKTSTLLLSALAGTAAMTAFSYLISGKQNKNFKEPELLGKAVKRALPAMGKEPSQFAGWLLHVGTGVIFAAATERMWVRAKANRNMGRVLGIGMINGAAGVMMWEILFKLHPAPPKHKPAKFFGHLLLAHIVFSGTVIAVLEIEKK